MEFMKSLKTGIRRPFQCFSRKWVGFRDNNRFNRYFGLFNMSESLELML